MKILHISTISNAGAGLCAVRINNALAKSGADTKIIAIAIVVVSVLFGVIWLCAGRVLYSYIALALNLYVCGPYIGMSFWQQMREVWRIYLGGAVAALCAYGVSFSIRTWCGVESAWWCQCLRLVVAGLTGFGFYVGCAVAFRFDVVGEVLELVSKLRTKIRN